MPYADIEVRKKYHKKYSRSWYLQNKDYSDQKNRDWYDQNRETINVRKAKRKRDRRVNEPGYRERCKETSRKYYNQPFARLKKLIWAAGDRSKKSNIPFDSDYMKSLAPAEICACCSRKLSYEGTGTPGGRDQSASIDKVDNSKGYVRGNVAIVCYECNRNKSNLDPKRLRELLTYIETHLSING